MKKLVFLFLVLILCLCGCGDLDAMFSKNPYRDEIVLPTTPPLATEPPAVSKPSEQAEEPEEAVPVGTTAPWETEFDEAGYTVIKDDFDGGVAYCWSKGYKSGRQVVYYDNGITEDSYFYPSGSMSHCCIWYADGSYSQTRWLDNGEVHTMPDGTKVSGMGTMCYSKTVQADGSYEECRFDPNGNLSKQIRMDSAAETYYEQDFYENGMPKWIQSQTPSEEREERYDEEGYLTYVHIQRTDYELEILTDARGKVVQVIENGQSIEDPAALKVYIESYNFQN